MYKVNKKVYKVNVQSKYTKLMYKVNMQINMQSKCTKPILKS